MKKNIHRTGDAQELATLLALPAEKNIGLACWSSPEALASWCEAQSIGDAWHKSPWESEKSFAGTSSMLEALSLARDGWPAGADRVARLRDKITAHNPTMRTLACYGVAGAVPDVQRYIAGNPQCMRRMDSVASRRRPVITLVANMSCPWFVEHGSITNAASVHAAIVDVIEASGYAVHLIATGNSMRNEVYNRTLVTIKEPHQPVDITRLAFGLGHASMYRRLVFCIMSADYFYKPLTGSLGHPQHVNANPANNVFMLPGCKDNEDKFKSEDACEQKGLAFCIGALRSQGCPAFPQEGV